MDVPSLTAVMTSLSLAKEGVSAAIGLRDFNASAAALAGVNDQLLKAQEGLFVYGARLAELQGKLAEANEELTELKRVRAERDNYALFELREGIFVYQRKPSANPSEGSRDAVEPTHYLCQGCFDQGKKFVLQLQNKHWCCSNCNTRLWNGQRDAPLQIPRF